ncbi:DNA helicase RecQ [Bianquea renquensis]|uniref:DNA helicase RecQ n=1 Tax=Bianquea renquensis TaxID=2763661 RepID=UPI003D2BB6CD
MDMGSRRDGGIGLQKRSVLKEYFGYDSFRPGQEELIDKCLQGRDVLGIMPTGAGKSICYQVPAMMFEGISLVISPLISLMQDQVEALIQAGIPAAYLNSSLSPSQFRKALAFARQGRYKLIYVAPERLLTPDFLDFALHAAISMVTIDEAHCVSQWGQDFRPSYLKIPRFIEMLSTRPVVSAFTATATQKVREDIMERLELQSPFLLTAGFDRSNLYFAVEAPKDKLEAVKAYLRKNPGGSGIVYCITRKLVEEVTLALQKAGYAATRYHAGLSDEERKRNQEDFLYDRARIMVATNAFGMGIDKSNVSFVIHYNMPKNMESYYQEAGRAGRDGSDADCILLYGGQDVVTNQFLIDRERNNEELSDEEKETIRQREQELLKTMTFYCHTRECLRQYILRYFGEKTASYCGNCSNCKANFEEVDVTRAVKQILLCVHQTRERFGVKMVVDVLRGSKGKRLQTLSLDELSTYGSLADESETRIREIITQLELMGCLEVTAGEYPILRLFRQKAKEVLHSEEPIRMKIVKDVPMDKGGHGRESAMSAAGTATSRLFERLRRLRASIAASSHVPSYVVFSDATLRDMCSKMPITEEEFLKVSGVGQAKLEKYGPLFLDEIKAFLMESAGGTQ